MNRDGDRDSYSRKDRNKGRDGRRNGHKNKDRLLR